MYWLEIDPEHWCNFCEGQHNFFASWKNIENRVAWFLAELCKAERGVQKRQAKPAPGRAR
jgi:hypothetical protein